MTEPKARLLVIGAGVNGFVCAAGLHREVDVSVLAALAPGRPPVLSRIARICRGCRAVVSLRTCRGAVAYLASTWSMGCGPNPCQPIGRCSPR